MLFYGLRKQGFFLFFFCVCFCMFCVWFVLLHFLLVFFLLCFPVCVFIIVCTVGLLCCSWCCCFCWFCFWFWFCFYVAFPIFDCVTDCGVFWTCRARKKASRKFSLILYGRWIREKRCLLFKKERDYGISCVLYVCVFDYCFFCSAQLLMF